MEAGESSDRVILVNKPLEWTSFDVVRKLKYKLKVSKIGHAGTLDPLATGLLILCTGKLTKKIDEYQAQEKEYTGRFVIGQTTPSHDLETEVNETFDISHVTVEKIHDTARAFLGVIEQLPPMYSAIKINGQRAYELARKGETAELKKRPVTISEFEITAIELPSVSFRVVCTKGTYIRSLARDYGLALGAGAYLAELCRTRIGSFRLEDAQEIEDIVAA
ncbi:MAG TPA: tRNA pseudouridine(55) synthase TruB [Cyclobacteriaceae bacterium]|nr:tRNA pseudouridine(55) synthase TruB [Cyclobacteriaceae bacterium]